MPERERRCYQGCPEIFCDDLRKDIADFKEEWHMKSTFEKMGGTYTLGADGIYYPNLVSTDEEPHYGKYGMMRKTYLKEHRPAMYSLYMLEDRLVEHLNLVDDEAQERMDILVCQMMEKQGITEELKARDQMEWVRAVNGIRNMAEEIVLKELIYR